LTKSKANGIKIDNRASQGHGANFAGGGKSLSKHCFSVAKMLACGLACLAESASAAAPTQMEVWSQQFELRLGILGHDTGYLDRAYPRNHNYAISLELLFPSPSFISFAFDPRPKIGLSLSEEISFVYAGLNWDAPVYGGWYVHGGFGGSYNNADRLTERDLQPGENKDTHRLVGCYALFQITAGFGYRFDQNINLQFYGEHLSNMNLCDNNEGLDQWGVRLGYAF